MPNFRTGGPEQPVLACPDCLQSLAIAEPGCSNHDLHYEIAYLKQDLRTHRASCASHGEVARLRRVEDTLVELGAPNTGGLMIAWLRERMADLVAVRAQLAAHSSPEKCAATWAATYGPEHPRVQQVRREILAQPVDFTRLFMPAAPEPKQDEPDTAPVLDLTRDDEGPSEIEVFGWCERCKCDVSGETHYHCHRCGQRTSMMGHRDGCPPMAALATPTEPRVWREGDPDTAEIGTQAKDERGSVARKTRDDRWAWICIEGTKVEPRGEWAWSALWLQLDGPTLTEVVGDKAPGGEA